VREDERPPWHLLDAIEEAADRPPLDGHLAALSRATTSPKPWRDTGPMPALSAAARTDARSAASHAAQQAKLAAGALAWFAGTRDETRSADDAFVSRLAAEVVERREQAALIRCIFGNPFRPVAVAPAWLAWGDGTVPKLAAGIYAERAFDRAPILADALEDAGCAEGSILSHLRGSGTHARGCWVIDLILGK
jgi:hypothetical protein